MLIEDELLFAHVLAEKRRRDAVAAVREVGGNPAGSAAWQSSASPPIPKAIAVTQGAMLDGRICTMRIPSSFFSSLFFRVLRAHIS